MDKHFLLGTTVALTLAASGASAGQGSLLWNQNANFGQPIISVNTDNGDSALADDFDVPSGQTWTLSEVDVTGQYFNGSGPATAGVVTFYTRKKKTPGRIQAGPFTIKCGDNSGVFSCMLPQAVKLKAGTWWVSFAANCNFDSCGEWGWTTNTTVQGHPAVYRSSFAGSKCLKFKPTHRCLGGGPIDMAFQIRGTSTGAK